MQLLIPKTVAMAAITAEATFLSSVIRIFFVSFFMMMSFLNVKGGGAASATDPAPHHPTVKY